MKNALILTVIALTIITYACKPTNESEDRGMKNNKTKVASLKEKYPALSEMLDIKLKEAEKLYEEAGKISNEEEKIKKKKEANDIFNTPFMRDLSAIEPKMEDLEDAVKDMIKKKYEKSDLKKVEKARDDSYDLISEIKQILTKGGSEDELKEILRKKTTELISMKGKVGRITKEALK